MGYSIQSLRDSKENRSRSELCNIGVFGTTISVSSEVSSSSVPMCECPCGSGLTVSTQSVSSSYRAGNLKSYSYSVSAPSVSSSYGSGNPTSYSYSVSSTNKTQNYATSSYYTSSSLTPVCYCPCGTSTSVVNAISVSGIQPTPSSVLNASTSAVVSSSINDFATEAPSSVVDHTSLCECPCHITSRFLAQASSSVSDLGSLSSFTSSAFGQRSSILAESSWSVYDSGSHSSFTNSVFGQISSALEENSRSLYDSEGLSSSASSAFAESHSVSGENSWSVYGSENPSSSTPMVFAQNASVPAETSLSVYDSENLSSSTSMGYIQDTPGSVIAPMALTVSENLVSSASTGLMQDISSVSGSLTSYSSSVGRKIISPTNTYRMSSRSASSVCYCPCNTSTPAPSPISTVSGIQPTSSSVLNASTSAVVSSSINDIATEAVVSPTPTPSVASNMYPYGPQQKDNEFGLDDSPYYYSDHCLKIKTDWIGIPFFSERHYKLYICRNGIIQLNYEWSWWWPRKFGIYWWSRNMGIIAPFWATTDSYFAFRYGNSKVYYQVYSQTKETSNEILDIASKHVQSYNKGFGEFKATWVLVVTWEKLCPYVYYPYYYYYRDINEQNFQLNCPRSNTFQAVLITDGFNAFLMYNYPPKGIQWLVDTEPCELYFILIFWIVSQSNTFQAVLITNGFNAFLMYNYPSKGIQWLVDEDPDNYRYWTYFYGLPVAGWNAGDDGEHFENLKGSGTFGLTEIDKKAGNTGVVGRHFWRIENSDGEGAQEKCLRWDMQNRAWKVLDRYEELIQSDSEMACPCTGWQAFFDRGRFRWNWRNSWPELCFESRRSKRFEFNTTDGPLEFELIQQCCYSTQWEDWLSLKFGPPDGGRVKLTFPDDSNNRTKSFYTDEQAYKYCCVDSLNCDLFYELRPSDSCSNYVPQFRLTFVATDEQNASAIWSPTIRMCACQHDGQCVEPQEGDAVKTDSKFVYLGCVCQGGYTGRFCDSEINACEWNGEPCYAGVKCIDLPPPANSSGYECGPCPSGYTGNGAQCVDIDECKKNSPKECEHKCVNTPGSFFCDCNDGFKLKDDRRNCEDIDECFPTSDCMQNCNNAVGSYNCSCREYFKTDPTDWKKCVAKNPCTSDSDPGCNHVCYEDSNKQAACTCRANFELQSDGKTCEDINECDPTKDLHRCDQTCTNTPGSYICSCKKGFELKKDGYGCEDINECLDDDTYECPDKNQRCVNTRGSYRCECVQDTYYFDGKCQGLKKNQPSPKLPLPKPRNASESEKEEAVQFSIPSGIEWDYDRDKSFKTVVATVASDFCNKNRILFANVNALTCFDFMRLPFYPSRRSSYNVLYDYEKVHLLPGYPKNSSDSLHLAFYVLQPDFLFIGNSSVLPRDTLVAIMTAHKPDIEEAIGTNISGIEALFKPPTTTESPIASNMYPYGPQQKDNEFGLDDSRYYYYYYYRRCLKINTDWIGIPFFSERHYKLYICRNGIIQLDYEWSWWWPRKFGIYWWLRNMGIIAPFWATTDSYFAFRYGHSKVYYQVYRQAKETSNEILDMASKHVQSYNKGFGDFKATWVLVVTWEKLCPYVYYPYYYYYRDINEQNFQLNCPRSNTFQAVLITDGFNAFLMYNYPPKGIQWLVDTEP
ncbi:mucin-like protein [Stylophora pistillata]|uniref:mucin-like protein n=1 Tax=Stylophora pistillata TaxID=50429 RepID=UPI000C0430B5|nr:mucin-like protein [Stylophora pistillata]